MRIVPVMALAALPLAAQTTNPFPAPIPKGPVVADVGDFAAIPDSAGQPARVNQLVPLPDGRLFVIDQRGPIVLVSVDGRSVSPFLDLSTFPGVDLQSGGEQGLLSLAFHPDFLTAGAPGYGRFYTAQTSGNLSPPADFVPGAGGDAGDNVVLEWRVADPVASSFVPADSAAPFREILRVQAPFGNHTMGLLAFNPNSAAASVDRGMLYIAIGDGGGGGDPFDLAQNPRRAHGKIFRLDPLGTNSANGRYGIPADNPFVGNAAFLPEIWALGFRNPQRFSWDTQGAKRMLIADIGQGVIEEIDIGEAGANYGWNEREGSFEYLGGQVGDNVRTDGTTSGFTYPIAEYDHSEGDSVTAGFVVRAPEYPFLSGLFLFGDIAGGRVFTLAADNPPQGGQSPIRELRLRFSGVERSFLEQIRTLRPGAARADLRFGTDFEGRIFLLNKQDGIVRVLEGTAIAANVKIAGKRNRVTRNARIRIGGRASASAGIRAVKVKVNDRKFRRADGTTRWRYRPTLEPGKNRLRVISIAKDGTRSATAVLKVRYRP